MPGSYQLVDEGPRFTPLRYGLLSAADEVPDSDRHWQLGIEFQGQVCAVPLTVSGGPCKATGISKVPTATGVPASAAEAFTVYAWMNCAPIGQGQDLVDLERRTKQLLTNGEGRAVERTFWTGVAANGNIRPRLASNAQVFAESQGATTVELQSAATLLTASGTPVDIVEGLSLIEGYLSSCYGGEGIIHIPAAALPVLNAYGDGLVHREGAVLRTMAGHKVAVYASNNRQGPDGTNPTAGSTWIYATGNVFYRRSEIKTTGTRPGDYVGRSKNSTVYVVERTYVLDWDCCHAAALVSLGGVTSGAVGS